MNLRFENLRDEVTKMSDGQLSLLAAWIVQETTARDKQREAREDMTRARHWKERHPYLCGE